MFQFSNVISNQHGADGVYIVYINECGYLLLATIISVSIRMVYKHIVLYYVSPHMHQYVKCAQMRMFIHRL